MVVKVTGISSAKGMPEWMDNVDVEAFESISTVANIRRADLSDAQRIFVTIIKKTFFQPGSGRKEEALLRGLGTSDMKRTANRILKLLINEDILAQTPGVEGWIYAPQRRHSKRMAAILDRLTLSDDSLWMGLGKL